MSGDAEKVARKFLDAEPGRVTAGERALAELLIKALDALRAAEGVLFALPKSAQSKRRREVLAQVRAARSGGE